jgi:hypothetical protein
VNNRTRSVSAPASAVLSRQLKATPPLSLVQGDQNLTEPPQRRRRELLDERLARHRADRSGKQAAGRVGDPPPVAGMVRPIDGSTPSIFSSLRAKTDDITASRPLFSFYVSPPSALALALTASRRNRVGG